MYNLELSVVLTNISHELQMYWIKQMSIMFVTLNEINDFDFHEIILSFYLSISSKHVFYRTGYVYFKRAKVEVTRYNAKEHRK